VTFSSVDGLLDSLAAPPPTSGLSKGHDATDHITLSMLAREEEVRKLAGRQPLPRPPALGSLPGAGLPQAGRRQPHRALRPRLPPPGRDGALPDEWVAGQIATLGNVEGDLDTLMARLASIRVWSYVAARADWLRDAARFQNEARAAEDAVSDALHERLTARFVDRRAAHLIRRLDDTEEELLSAVTRQGEVVVEGHPVGRVSGFLFQPEAGEATEEERRLVLRAARRALREEMPRRVAALETAADDAFALTPDHRVTWTAAGGEPAEVARLRPGPEPSKPAVDVCPASSSTAPSASGCGRAWRSGWKGWSPASSAPSPRWSQGGGGRRAARPGLPAARAPRHRPRRHRARDPRPRSGRSSRASASAPAASRSSSRRP
jgi:ATP-dependent RNA helicase SUPV3L1/SUV3